MTTGIFGCSADPFTPAHKEIVDKILESKVVDRVIITPTVVSYHRAGKEPWLQDWQKLDVIKSFFAGEDGKMPENVILDDKDVRMKKLCANSLALTGRFVSERRYIDTLVDIKLRYGQDDEYVTVIGTDSAKNFKSWFMYEEILEQSEVLVVLGRDGGNGLDADFKHSSFVISSDFESVSATKIREKYGKDPDGLNAYLADVKSGAFMKEYEKDRLTGRIVFFEKDVPCIYAGRGKVYAVACRAVQTEALALFDGTKVQVDGKLADDTFVLDRISKICAEEEKEVKP